jgi:chromosome segregation ATPase
MGSRANIAAESAALVSRVRFLETQQAELKAQIADAQQVIEGQHRQAGLMSAAMKRKDVPSLQSTQDRLAELRTSIEQERERQYALKTQTALLQDRINASIALRSKKINYDKVEAEIKSLNSILEAEQQRETTLKFHQAQLSPELLKAQLTKKQIEQKLTAEREPPPDITGLQRKRKGLIDQTAYVQKAREAFSQELEDAMTTLAAARRKREELVDLEQRAESSDPRELQKQILGLAADNTDLRAFPRLAADTDDVIAGLFQLSENAGSVIQRVRAFLG